MLDTFKDGFPMEPLYWFQVLEVCEMRDTTSIIGDCLAEVRRAFRNARTGGQPDSAAEEYDRLTHGMIERIANLSEDQRRVIIAKISRAESGFLLGIALSAAIWSVRENSHRGLRFGLLALIFEDLTEDYRETLMMLCLLDNSSRRLGVNLEEIYAPLQCYASEEVRELFKGYLTEGSRDISAMGYVEGVDKGGEFTYLRTF